ncbi:MAG: hypothetical protein A2Z34_08395 [Planctomycetes bacterium RBG_16_59_8]|nr:MAG: hypothetical protein A2Z34_08395 [Planctomycetes bacterium RBG_16_59_8]
MAKTLSKAELKEFQGLLLKRKLQLTGDYAQLEKGVLRKNIQDSAGDLSSMPSHLADLGSDNFEQDVTFGLLEGEQEELKLIDEAMERIREKTYGTCEECSKSIPKIRLKALPFVRLCVNCQTKEEKS